MKEYLNSPVLCDEEKEDSIIRIFSKVKLDKGRKLGNAAAKTLFDILINK
jgi:hypothetical protein